MSNLLFPLTGRLLGSSFWSASYPPLTAQTLGFRGCELMTSGDTISFVRL